MESSSASVRTLPPVMSMLAARTRRAAWAKVMPWARRSSSRKAISISSSGSPCNSTLLMPSMARRSSSTRRAMAFNARRSTSSPLRAKLTAGRMFSTVNVRTGSMPSGSVGMRSTAFCTSISTSSVS